MKKHRRQPLAEINVVPYIDVMLVLLVIFMITAPLLTQGVKINLPQAQAKNISSKDHEPIIVSIDAKGNYYLNVDSKPNEAINLQTLVNRIAAEISLAHQAGQNLPVFVKGDRDVPYGKVVMAMVLLQKAGVEHVGLMTKPEA